MFCSLHCANEHNYLDDMLDTETNDKLRCAQQLNGVWDVLNDDDRNLLLHNMQVDRYTKNGIIYRVGETPRFLFCLIEGKAKIFREGLGGRTLTNRVLRQGQYFGYRAYMAGEDYVTTASALEESLVAAIPMAVVMELTGRNARLAQFFMHELAVDLGKSDRRIVSITQKHIRGRLAETLLDLADVYGYDDDGRTLNIRITREDIANLSNMTTSNAIRTLSSFADDGLVSLQGKNIEIIDLEKLHTVSRNG